MPRATGETKVCARCQTAQPLDNFHHNQGFVDRRCPYCKTCKRAKSVRERPRRQQTNRQYRDRHRDRLNEIARRYRREHGDERRAADRAYHAEHRDERTAAMRARRRDRHDEVIARDRAYYDRNRERINARRRQRAAERRAARPVPEDLRPRGSDGRVLELPRFPVTDSHKTCRRCRIAQPADQFHHNQRYTDGRCPYCKTCKRQKYADAPAAQPSSTQVVYRPRYPLDHDGYKRCRQCLRRQPGEHFAPSTVWIDGRAVACATCSALRAEWHQRDQRDWESVHRPRNREQVSA